MAMDSVQVESYSFRWLTSMKDDSTATAASFIDIDPRLMSLRWTGGDSGSPDLDVTHESFDFGTLKVSSHSPAHPGEHEDDDGVVSGGILLPVDHTPSSTGDDGMLWSPESVLSRYVSLDSTRVLLSTSKRYDFLSPSLDSTSSSVTHPESRLRPSMPATGAKVSKFLKKYLCFLMPLYKKVKDLNKERELKRRRRSSGMEYHRGAGRATVDVVDEGPEKSIYEAVLHCKKSIQRD